MRKKTPTQKPRRVVRAVALPSGADEQPSAAAPQAVTAAPTEQGHDRRRLFAVLGLAAVFLVFVLLATINGGGGTALPATGQQTTTAATDAVFAGVDRNDVSALMRRGKELYDQNRFDDAVTVYKEVIRLKPDNQAAYSNLGSSYFRLQKLDEALQAFRQAVQLNPNDAEARQNLGAGLAAQGNFDDAIKEYLQAIALKPDLAPAHYSLGVLYQEQGNKDKAVTELQRYLDLGQDDQLRADAQRRLQSLGVK